MQKERSAIKVTLFQFVWYDANSVTASVWYPVWGYNSRLNCSVSRPQVSHKILTRSGAAASDQIIAGPSPVSDCILTISLAYFQTNIPPERHSIWRPIDRNTPIIVYERFDTPIKGSSILFYEEFIVFKYWILGVSHFQQ